MEISSGTSTRWLFIHCVQIRYDWNSKMLVFEERGKQKNPEKNLVSEQGRESTTNSTHT